MNKETRDKIEKKYRDIIHYAHKEMSNGYGNNLPDEWYMALLLEEEREKNKKLKEEYERVKR